MVLDSEMLEAHTNGQTKEWDGVALLFLNAIHNGSLTGQAMYPYS